MLKTMLMIAAIFLPVIVMGIPQQGQIVVDPDHPGRMVYNDVYENSRLKPCFFAGPGDPEDFFYNNTQANIDLLVAKGARCTYITAYLGDFGGGDPGTGTTLDATLNTWETYITALENAEIITVFFFYDDSKARPSTWQTDVDKIVAKFKHHKLLVWSIAEEYSEELTISQVSEVAARIKSQDEYGHVVGVHQLNGTSFNFNNDANLEMFLIQYNVSTPDAIHTGMVNAWNNTGGNKIINMSEIANHATQTRAMVRKWNWAAAMGGASAIQILGMGRASDPSANNEQGKYDDCVALMDFFEGTDVNAMAPRDDLKSGATKWLLAYPGHSYIAYTDNLNGNMGVADMTAGSYSLQWLDITTGTVSQTQATLTASANTVIAPVGFSGHEVAVWITNGSTGATPILTSVVVSPPADTILVNGSATFIGQAKDQYGANFSETLVWSVNGGGSVSNGTFTSNGTAGTYLVIARAASDAGVRDTAMVVARQEYPAPVADNADLTTQANTLVGISLPFHSISQGPFSFIIIQQPVHGTATATGNDAEYTPENGFMGLDTFTWKVTDLSNGKESDTAVVTITVEGMGKVSHYNDFPEKSLRISAWPNPFNPSVIISVPGLISLQQPSRVCIFDTGSRLVADLSAQVVDDTVSWNASNVPSGIYFIKVTYGGTVFAKKISLIR